MTGAFDILASVIRRVLESLLWLLGLPPPDRVNVTPRRVRGEPVPEPAVTANVLADSRAAETESAAGFARVDLAGSFWGANPPAHQTRTRPERRVGWLLVGAGVAAILLLAIYLVLSESDLDPNDSGAAEVGLFVGPILAFVAALSTGVLIAAVAALGWITLDVRRAGRAALAGMFVGPVLYLVLFALMASPMDSAQSGLLIAIVLFLGPAICGIGSTLVAAVLASRTSTHG